MDILWIFYGDVRIFYVDIMAYHIGDIPFFYPTDTVLFAKATSSSTAPWL